MSVRPIRGGSFVVLCLGMSVGNATMTENTDDTGLGDQLLRRVLAKDAIESGRIPAHRTSRMWGGQGQGEFCAVCLMQISPPTLGYELEFADAADGAATHFLHLPCYRAWEAECTTSNEKTHSTNGQLNGQARGSGSPGNAGNSDSGDAG
jgi:hypothetical protein